MFETYDTKPKTVPLPATMSASTATTVPTTEPTTAASLMRNTEGDVNVGAVGLDVALDAAWLSIVPSGPYLKWLGVGAQVRGSGRVRCQETMERIDSTHVLE